MCKECHSKYAHSNYIKNRARYIRQAHKRYYKDVEKSRARIREAHKRDRALVLKHYGNKCACCGEKRMEFLTIEHKHGGGRLEKRGNRATGKTFYRWVIKNEYPKHLEVLCWNCNLAKYHYGVCPHQKEKQQ